MLGRILLGDQYKFKKYYIQGGFDVSTNKKQCIETTVSCKILAQASPKQWNSRSVSRKKKFELSEGVWSQFKRFLEPVWGLFES